MADSIPSLRRKLDEANAEIARLRDVVSNRPVKVVDRVVEREVPFETVVYKDRVVEVEVPGPERVEYVDRVVEREVPGPERIEYVDRVVKVEVPVYRTKYIEYPTVEYIENPEHLRMIEELQGKLEAWRAISQSDS